MKKLSILLLLGSLTITLTSCSHIEDTNGEDTSLASFTMEEKIESGSFSATESVSSTVSSGGTTYSFLYEEIDYDYISMNVAKFSGVSRVHVSDMREGSTLTLVITSELESGNLEIVVVDPNDEIHTIVPINETVTVTINSTIEGEYFVIVGGETAKYSITIDRTID